MPKHKNRDSAKDSATDSAKVEKWIPMRRTLHGCELSINFDPALTAEQIRSTLSALADYYRACGGVGFEVDCELEESSVPESLLV